MLTMRTILTIAHYRSLLRTIAHYCTLLLTIAHYCALQICLGADCFRLSFLSLAVLNVVALLAAIVLERRNRTSLPVDRLDCN
jgi:hypothetical protein